MINGINNEIRCEKSFYGKIHDQVYEITKKPSDFRDYSNEEELVIFNAITGPVSKIGLRGKCRAQNIADAVVGETMIESYNHRKA
ncbi:MAG: hypothetical protein KJ697_00950 [Nanoarchaeota archaeon]|nr:hypothetical protein [Nanoarchaeota archaeon]